MTLTPDEPTSDLDARLGSLRKWMPEAERGGWIRVRRLSRTRRRRSFVRRVAAIGVASLTVGVGVVLLTGPEGPELRTTDLPVVSTTTPEDPPDPTTTAAGGFGSLDAGWHEIDTGPVPAGNADVEWSDGRLTVAVGSRLFRFDPGAGAWEELPPPPFSGPVTTDIVTLTDGSLLAVSGRFGETPSSARLDPTSGEWTDLGIVPSGFASVEPPGFEGPRDPNSNRALLWTGERVIDFTSGAAFDSETDEWSTVTMPGDILSYTHLLYTNPVTVGGETILAHPHRLDGLRWDANGSTYEAFDGMDAGLLGDAAVDTAFAIPLDDGRVFFVSGAMTATYDPTTDAWDVVEAPPGLRAETGCPARAATVAGDPVVWPCADVDAQRWTGGQWTAVPAPDNDLENWLGLWVGADDALVVWHPEADAGPGARPTMRVWVPEDPPAPSDWDSMPAGWTSLAPPLAPRTGATLAATDEQLFVVGGWEFLCPPAADCSLPVDEPFRDGAVLDLVNGGWTMLPATPFPVVHASAAIVGDELFLRCPNFTVCTRSSLLRLRPDRSGWDELPDLPAADVPVSHHLVAVGSTLYAFADSDQFGSGADYRFDDDAEAWVALPNDPLPSVGDRRVVDVDGDPLLVASSLDEFGFPAARFDLATESWSTVGELILPGFQIALVDGLVYREPHFGSTSGGVLDPATGTWEFWPELPAGIDLEQIAGVMGGSGGAYWRTAGWVWDTRAGEYREVDGPPAPAGWSGGAVSTVGDRLVVYGGEVWPPSGAGGSLSGELWVWVP